MLRNEIYRGRIMHKGRSYPGRHAAIVDEALWKAVQERLAVNRVKRQTGGHAAEPSCYRCCAVRSEASLSVNIPARPFLGTSGEDNPQ